MFNRYLVTGATGFLGHTVVHMLANRHKAVTALVLPEDPGAQRLALFGVDEVCCGVLRTRAAALLRIEQLRQRS